MFVNNSLFALPYSKTNADCQENKKPALFLAGFGLMIKMMFLNYKAPVVNSLKYL